jgi:regulator of sigma E protease
MDLRTILIFLITFTALIFVHELGHYVTARLTKMRVLEFGFGFPPRVFAIVHAGIAYSVNAIPFGGFVRILGEDGLPTTPDGRPQPDSFAARPIPARALVLVAGVLMNVFLAFGLYTANFMTADPAFNGKIRWAVVEPGSPADEAGMRDGDIIAKVDGQTFLVPDEMPRYIRDHAGQPISITLIRDGQIVEVTAVPRRDPPPPVRCARPDVDQQGPLGLCGPEPVREVIASSFPDALVLASQKTVVMLQMIVREFSRWIGGLITGSGGGEDVTGPVGIFSITSQVAQQGRAVLFEFIALLSLNLAIINIIPFPGLDGGRLLFVTIEAVRGGRRLDPRTEAAIHAAGFLLLLSLVAIVSFFDIRRITGG